MKIIFDFHYSCDRTFRLYLKNINTPTCLSFHNNKIIYNVCGSEHIARKWARRLKIKDVR